MNMNKHTPGPWIFDPTNTGNVFEVCVGIYSEPNKDSLLARPTVANVPIDSENYETDARLITAAPDLLAERNKLREAAKAYRDLCTCYRLGTRPSEALFERLDKADAALVESAKQMEEKP